MQELHYKVVDRAFVAHIVEHADIGMLKLRDDLGFPFEAGAQLGAGHQLRVQNFDGDRPLQSRITGAIHFTHTARAEGRFDFVGAKSGASGQSHRSPQL